MVYQRIVKDRRGKALMGPDAQPRRHRFYSYAFQFKGKQVTGTTTCADPEGAKAVETARRYLLSGGTVAQANILLLRGAAAKADRSALLRAGVLRAIAVYLANEIDANATNGTRRLSAQALRGALDGLVPPSPSTAI